MKKSTLFWLGIIATVLIAIGAAAGAGGGKTGGASQQGRTKATCKFTIYSAPQVTAIMIDYVIYVNENYPNETACIYYNELPKSFNFGKDEVLSFEVVTKSGYTLNYWLPDEGRPYHDNPLQYQASDDFTLTIWVMRTTTP